MAYPISASVVSQAYTTLNNDLAQLRARCLGVQGATVSGASAPLYLALNVASACITYQADFATIAGNSALVAQLVPYVQAQLAGASSLSVTTEYTNLNTLAGNLLNAFALDYPHDAQGTLLDRTFSLAGGEVWKTFTAAQGPNFMPAVTAMLAAFT